MNKKQIIKVVTFLLILAVLVHGIGRFLVEKFSTPCYETVAQHEFYEQEKNSIDVLFVGSSQVSEGIAIPYLYNEYGISAYSIGSSSQPLQVSYMWMKEARKTQDLEVVVLDVSRLYQTSPTQWYHKGLVNMKFSLDKMKDLWEYCSTQEEADPFLSFLFPMYKYHERWAGLTKYDFTALKQDNNCYRGFFVRKTHVETDIDVMAYDNDKPNPNVEMIDYQFKYLEKIVQYCKENNQKLLLIKTPKYDWSISKHEQMQKYADANGLTFLDCSSRAMIEELGLDLSIDMGDEEHFNILGAQKFTSWIGKYLKENYELTDYRGTEHGEFLQKEYERCERYAAMGRALLLNDVKAYFECMNNDRYEVLIQLSAHDAGVHSAEMTQLMQSLGLKTDMEKIDGKRYLAWIQNGEVKYEGSEKQFFEFADKFANGKGFRMYSNFDETVTAKMRVNFKDVVFQKHGMNILIYDSEADRIMTTYTIYSDKSGALKLYGY